MVFLLQPKRVATPHIGIATILMVLWLAMFCHHCLAAVGVAPDKAGDPAPCQHDNPEPLSGGQNTAPNPDDCVGQCDTISISAVPQTGFKSDGCLKQPPSGEPDFLCTAAAHAAGAGPQMEARVHSYERSPRSYFLPFDRYTVLLN